MASACEQKLDSAFPFPSACTSASLEPSYVLRAIGADEDLAHSSIRCVEWSFLMLPNVFFFCLKVGGGFVPPLLRRIVLVLDGFLLV